MKYTVLFICGQCDYVRTSLSKVSDAYNFNHQSETLENRIMILLSQSVFLSEWESMFWTPATLTYTIMSLFIWPEYIHAFVMIKLFLTKQWMISNNSI